MTRTTNLSAGVIRVFPDYESGDHQLHFNRQRYRSALGHDVMAHRLKREGDGATPFGLFPLRQVFYRADRLRVPQTRLETQAIQLDDGWSDDPARTDYNQKVCFPYEGSAEKLWRADGLYDLVVPLGFNDQFTRTGRGSAIFLHVARDDYFPTRGCVALARDDLLGILKDAGPETMLRIYAPG